MFGEIFANEKVNIKDRMRKDTPVTTSDIEKTESISA